MEPRKDLYPELSHAIIGCAMRAHSALGPGMLESVYEEALSCELEEAALPHLRQVAIPVHYKGRFVETAFRIDILVDKRVVVEIKAVDQLLGVHESQLYTYMRMSAVPLGLLINFNVQHLRDGIKRRAYTK